MIRWSLIEWLDGSFDLIFCKTIHSSCSQLAIHIFSRFVMFFGAKVISLIFFIHLRTHSPIRSFFHSFLARCARSFCNTICSHVFVVCWGLSGLSPSLLLCPGRGRQRRPLLHPGAHCVATTGDSGRRRRCSPSRPSNTRTPSCSLELCASSARGRTTLDPGTVWRWPLPRRRRGRWRARPSAWWVP